MQMPSPSSVNVSSHPPRSCSVAFPAPSADENAERRENGPENRSRTRPDTGTSVYPSLSPVDTSTAIASTNESHGTKEFWTPTRKKHKVGRPSYSIVTITTKTSTTTSSMKNYHTTTTTPFTTDVGPRCFDDICIASVATSPCFGFIYFRISTTQSITSSGCTYLCYLHAFL